MATVGIVCVLTFLHYVCAQMRGPVLPLYAAAHGATATGVGLIMGAHMAVAAGASVPLGAAADVWGRRPLLLGGMLLGVLTSLALPLVQGEVALVVVFGLAGLGVAAFTPSALSLVGDAAPPGKTAQAYAWYSTAHYGAIAVGPFLGGLAAEWWGYSAAFVASGLGIAVALVAGGLLPIPAGAAASPRASFTDIRGNTAIWAAWTLAVSGMLVQGVVFTFFPLLAHERGLAPAAIGLVFLVLGLANTAIRIPTGWWLDRSRHPVPGAIGTLLVAALTTVLIPHGAGLAAWLALAAVFGAVSGAGFVAVTVALASVTAPERRGLVMGGYSTALYLGLALGSIALGPVIASHGYAVGFAAGAGASGLGIVAAAVLWRRAASIA